MIPEQPRSIALPRATGAQERNRLEFSSSISCWLLTGTRQRWLLSWLCYERVPVTVWGEVRSKECCQERGLVEPIWCVCMAANDCHRKCCVCLEGLPPFSSSVACTVCPPDIAGMVKWRKHEVKLPLNPGMTRRWCSRS